MVYSVVVSPIINCEDIPMTVVVSQTSLSFVFVLLITADSTTVWTIGALTFSSQAPHSNVKSDHAREEPFDT